MVRRNSNAKHWCFTLNNFTAEDVERLRSLSPLSCVYLIFGYEHLEEGTPHLQGFVSFSLRMAFNQVKEMLGGRCHIEACKSTPLKASVYCKKENNFEEFGELPTGRGKRNDWDDLRAAVVSAGRRLTNREVIDVSPALFARHQSSLDEIMSAWLPVASLVSENAELREGWQKDLFTMLENECVNDRSILFYVDQDGNSGKSFFCRYCLSKLPLRTQLVGIGKLSDIAFQVSCEKDIFLFDCERSASEFLQYRLLEQLKNRMVNSTKYQSKIKVLEKIPWVVVFMNEHPKMDQLTIDRYEINII